MFEEFGQCILAAKDQQDEKLTRNSYYLDTSGRACLSVPLVLSFPSEQCLKDTLDANCFYPRPKYDETTDDGTETQTSSSIAIEAKVALTFGSGEAIMAVVEQVRVHSTEIISPTSVLFETDIYIRVSLLEGNTRWRMTDVKVAIETSAVLSQRLPDQGDNSTDTALQLLKRTMAKSMDTDVHNVRSIRTAPISIKAHLTQALTVHVDSVSGPTVGETFLSIHIRHSSTHKEPVTVTRIALHPLQEELTHAVPRTTSSTIRWGFADHCDPCLPITLNPDESFSTIFLVDASQDSAYQTFKCPVSVTAILGKRESSTECHRYQVTASAKAEFTSSPMASEPSDGFVLAFQLIDEKVHIGSLVTVRVSVRNLSNDTRRNLTLWVGDNGTSCEEELSLAANEIPRLQEDSTESDDTIKITGLSLSEQINSPHQSLISLDTEYILPQIEGHTATTADLRFIPLVEGLVTFPHVHVVDRTKGVTYASFHKFRAVVGAQTSPL
ncbi:hypothetical protein FisN_1Hh710 [Fistulifera solaris]|jgi:hypothetical protein|uniref:Uncharacterized protein n=1 Tax=Fistulifera solaris TaxID=1519565 RepID=A0A1Z5JMM4_FISSO|nr:hypothetical protein FisN_1Hh710 [Fistulifera solaris]|eukprot:GAX15273.1 hypothetical protein FisN_1Hh710 [Fistulifera solaris]